MAFSKSAALPARWHRYLCAVLVIASAQHFVACASFGKAQSDLTASLRTDSTEIDVFFDNSAYHAKIGFTYVNSTPGPVAKSGCGFPPLPQLQKNVGGKWVTAYNPAYLACLTKPDFSLPSGGSYHGVLDFLAFQPGHNTMPTLEVDSIDGVYRLEWDFAQGTDAGVKNARTVKAISNEFRMVLRQ